MRIVESHASSSATTAIQTVVFDLGKVLVDFDYRIAAGALAARSRMSAQDIIGYLSREPLLYQYETGLLTSRQFYDQLCAITGFGGALEDFARLFAGIFEPIPPMIALQATVRRKGLPTYLLSNTNEFAVGYIRRHFPFFENFDGYVLSYEQKSMKPAAGIYEALERVSGRQGGQILYIDDLQENIEAGARRGWRVILHKSPEQTISEIKRLGLLPENWGPNDRNGSPHPT